MSEENSYQGFDKIYTKVPHFSAYQCFLLFFGSWVSFVAGAVQTASVILQASPEKYRCRNDIDNVAGASYQNASFASTSCRVFDVDWETECPKSNNAEDYANCAIEKQLVTNDTVCSICDDYVYSPDNTFSETVSTQFNWVCDDRAISIGSLSTCIFMSGLFFGAIGFGMISDYIGRRKGILLSASLTIVGNLALYWVNNPWTYTLIRWFCGVFAHGGMIVGYVFVMEFIGPDARSWVGSQYLQFFSLGYMSLSLVGYFARDWHTMQLVLGCMALPAIGFHFILPTSNRWLYSKNRPTEARLALKQFSKKCKTELDEKFISYVENQANTSVERVSSLDIFKLTKMRLITINSMYCWFVTSMVYYGLGLNAGSLSGNIFINNMLNGSCEIVARLIIPFCMEWKRLGRRYSLVLMFVICGSSCIISLLLKQYSDCVPITLATCVDDEIISSQCNQAMYDASKYLAFVGKFAVAGTFSILYVYSAELYPTVVRASAVGICSSGARIGGALSPLVFGLDGGIPWFSNTVFGTLAFIAAFTAYFLPETLGMPMSQTMEEAESYYYKTPEEVIQMNPSNNEKRNFLQKLETPTKEQI